MLAAPPPSVVAGSADSAYPQSQNPVAFRGEQCRPQKTPFGGKHIRSGAFGCTLVVWISLRIAPVFSLRKSRISKRFCLVYTQIGRTGVLYCKDILLGLADQHVRR